MRRKRRKGWSREKEGRVAETMFGAVGSGAAETGGGKEVGGKGGLRDFLENN